MGDRCMMVVVAVVEVVGSSTNDVVFPHISALAIKTSLVSYPSSIPPLVNVFAPLLRPLVIFFHVPSLLWFCLFIHPLSLLSSTSLSLPSPGKLSATFQLTWQDWETPEYVAICVRVKLLSRSPADHPPSLFPTDRSSGRAETTSYTVHRDSEATTPRVTSHTYLILGEQALDTH